MTGLHEPCQDTTFWCVNLLLTVYCLQTGTILFRNKEGRLVSYRNANPSTYMVTGNLASVSSCEG
jgi:hypothetical protein